MKAAPHRAAAAAALLSLLLLPSPASLAGTEKISGVVEEVTPAGVIVDSGLVYLESGGTLKGDARRLSRARPGWWLEAKGRWRKRGDFKAEYIKLKRDVPGHTFEGDLRKTSLKESGKLDESGKLYDDPALTSYVSGVGMSLVPAWASGEFDWSFHVIEDPSLNAFALPNGAIYVHTGLLARLDNEAQLASVLGHEVSHVTQRHGQRQYKSMLAWGIPAQIGAILVGSEIEKRTDNPVYALMAGMGMSLGLSAAVNGYGRNLEDQADRVGLRYMAAEGYEPREAPRVWDTFTDVYGDQGKIENFFWGNHSTNEVRRKNLRGEIRLHYPRDESGTDSAAAGTEAPRPAPRGAVKTVEYQDAVVEVTRRTAIEDYDLERYELAGKGFDRVIRRRPGDAAAWHYRGRVYLKTIADPGDARSRALAAYMKSIAFDPGYADVHRDLGLLYAESGQAADARSHLRRYLEMAPADAKDRKKINKALRSLP